MVIRHCPLAVVVILLGAIAVSAFAPAPVYKPRPFKAGELLTAMQGDWENHDEHIRGKGRKGLAAMKVHIEGNKWEYVPAGSARNRTPFSYEIAIDKTTSPPQIQLTLPPSSGFAARIRLKGIVKVEGEQVTICYVSGPTASRGEVPTSFDQTRTKSGYRVYSMVLNRAK